MPNPCLLLVIDPNTRRAVGYYRKLKTKKTFFVLTSRKKVSWIALWERDTCILLSYYRADIELLKVFDCYCCMAIKV